MHLIFQYTALIFSQAANQLTNPDTRENQSTYPDKRFQVSSVLSFPPVAVAVIRKLPSFIKNLIRLLSDLVACTGGTQLYLIAQDTASIFSQAANQSTDTDKRFQVSSVFLFPLLLFLLFGNYYQLSKTY